MSTNIFSEDYVAKCGVYLVSKVLFLGVSYLGRLDYGLGSSLALLLQSWMSFVVWWQFVQEKV
jgi:hypothetical protein